MAKFGFAVNNRKKNADTAAMGRRPVFLDMEAFNRGTAGKLADLVEQYLHKGQQVFIEGHLKLDQWDDKNGGGKRQQAEGRGRELPVPRAAAPDGGDGGEAMARAPRPAAAPQPAPGSRAAATRDDNYDDEPDMGGPPDRGGGGRRGRHPVLSEREQR